MLVKVMGMFPVSWEVLFPVCQTHWTKRLLIKGMTRTCAHDLLELVYNGCKQHFCLEKNLIIVHLSSELCKVPCIVSNHAWRRLMMSALDIRCMTTAHLKERSYSQISLKCFERSGIKVLIKL